MRLPNALIIDSLTDFCVCHFKDSNHAPEAPPHYYATIPVIDKSSLLISIITSKKENKIRYYSRVNKTALQSMVPVDEKILSFLSKPSIIDCNQVELIRKEELELRIDPKHKINVISRDIPVKLKDEIVEAIKKSPLVKPYIKNLIKLN